METRVEPLRLESQKLLAKVVGDYWQEAKEAKEQGRLIAWSTPFYPTDILEAAGIFTIIPENHAATCAVRKVSTDFCMVAESNRFPIDLCSYARTELGSIFGGVQTESRVPEQPAPDVILMSNNQCTTIAKWFESMSRIFNIPLLIIDTPIIHDNATSEDIRQILNYVKLQLGEHIAFLEKLTGRHFDYDRFKQCVGFTGQMGRLFGEILETGRNIPSPLIVFDSFVWLFPILSLRGKHLGVECYQNLKAELDERVRQKIGAMPNERYRLLWDDGPIWFEIGKQSRIFASYGACPIIGPYPLNWKFAFEGLDSSRPLDSTAEGIILPYANRAIGYRIDLITRLVEQYSLDGLVMMNNRTCKAYVVGQSDIAKVVEERIGAPAVIIDGDLCDSRLYSESRFNMQISTLIDIIEDKRHR